MKGSDPISTFAQRRPVGFALTLWFAMLVVYIIIGGVAQYLQITSTTRALLFGGVLSVLGLLVVAG